MKKLYLLFFFIRIGLQAQTWVHAKLDPNYNCWNEMRASVLDAGDNLYMAGTFEPCYHGGGAYGIYLNKYDPNGNLVWSDTVCSPNLDVTALFLTANNILCLAGPFYNDTTNFFGFIFNSNDTNIGYKAEFDLSGNCLNANLLPYVPMKAQLNADGTMSMAGQCFQPITNLNYQPPSTFFVGVFSDFSTAYWLQPVSFPAYNFDPLMATTSSGEIFLYEQNGQIKRYTGTSSTTVTWANYPAFYCPGNSFYLGRMYNTGLLEKYTSSGNLVWQKSLGALTFVSAITSYNNHLLVAGYFKNSFQYGSFYAQDTSTSSNYFNLFLLETDTNGNEINVLYAFHANEPCSYSVITPKEIMTHGGDIFITGDIQSGMAFGTDTVLAGCEDPNYVFHAKAGFYNAGISKAAGSESGPNFYPNPFREKTCIDLSAFNSKEDLLVTLFSSTNVMITKQTCGGKTCSLSGEGLPPGLYFYRIANKEGTPLTGGMLVVE